MRVVFNVLSTIKPKTGVGHYAARLGGALVEQMSPGSLRQFPGDAARSLIRLAQRKSPDGGPGTAIRLPWLKDQVRRAANTTLATILRVECLRQRFDLYHEPNFIPLTTCLPTIVTVHDLSVLRFPQWHPTDRVRRHENAFRGSLASAAYVITDSNVIRQEVHKTLGVPLNQISAIHLGVGLEYFDVSPVAIAAVRAKFALPRDFLLYVGTLEPRKNLLTLLKAYCAIPDHIRRKCPLVLAGGWGWQADAIAAYFNDVAVHRGVLHLGYVADFDLPGLYSAARVLVFPSHYEGFGLPPLEMLATGGAVIASTAGVHREVLADHASFVAADDADGWRDQLTNAITNQDWVNEMRRGGREYAAGFTWQKCAKATLGIYSKVLSNNFAA